MEVTTARIKELREKSGAGIMECRSALLETGGDLDKALQVLKEHGYIKAQKRLTRAATQGLIEAYIHTGGRVGAMVELNCETDFVARTDEFKHLAHDLAMQVAAMCPQYISEEEVPDKAEVDLQVACLQLQPFIKDPNRTIQDLITEIIAKTGENVKIRRFVRYELGKTEKG
jgi:elongation factor Ts